MFKCLKCHTVFFHSRRMYSGYYRKEDYTTGWYKNDVGGRNSIRFEDEIPKMYKEIKEKVIFT